MPNHVDVSALIRFHYIASHKLILLRFCARMCSKCFAQRIGCLKTRDGELGDTIGLKKVICFCHLLPLKIRTLTASA